MSFLNNKDTRKIGAFISIPKCGTKTILEMFNLGFNRDNDSDDPNNHFIIYENHQRLSVLEKKYDLRGKYIFTFVRHPYSRTRSWFYYHKGTDSCKDKTLNEWISCGCPVSRPWTHTQNMTNWGEEKITPLLQYNFVEGKTKINYIGKMENFEEDCKNIAKELNILFRENHIPRRVEYKKIKNYGDSYKLDSTKNFKKEEITQENKELIYKMFRKDFEYFGYSK